MSRRRAPPSDHSFTLPRALLARLLIRSAELGDKPLDVLIDAVDLHLDEIEGAVDVHHARASRTALDDARENEHRTAEARATGGSGPASLHTGGSPPSDDQAELPNFLRRRSP